MASVTTSLPSKQQSFYEAAEPDFNVKLKELLRQVNDINYVPQEKGSKNTLIQAMLAKLVELTR